MIIPYKPQISAAEQDELVAIGKDHGVEIRPIIGEHRTIYAIIGDESSELLIKRLEGLDFIEKVDRIDEPYKLLSHKSNFAGHEMRTKTGKIFGKDFVMIAGHCTIDPKNPEFYLETAQALKEAGVDMLRGGVWKPRTSPYSYQGDAKALDTLLRARELTGLEVVTEVMDFEQVKICVENGIDCFQIGARNALNYRLLAQIGELTADTKTKVLLKRSIHMGKVDEFILAAEYIAGNGNPNVMLTPRGTLPAVDGYRNNPDECITPLLKEKTWAPVVVDPSHSVGKARYVPNAALAAAAYGADGVIIETHCNPTKGIGDDPKQAVTPAVIASLIPQLQALHAAARGYLHK
jgi:3-deoxy-7-phosphoheptulonate synthase